MFDRWGNGASLYWIFLNQSVNSNLCVCDVLCACVCCSVHVHVCACSCECRYIDVCKDTNVQVHTHISTSPVLRLQEQATTLGFFTRTLRTQGSHPGPHTCTRRLCDEALSLAPVPVILYPVPLTQRPKIRAFAWMRRIK